MDWDKSMSHFAVDAALCAAPPDGASGAEHLSVHSTSLSSLLVKPLYPHVPKGVQWDQNGIALAMIA